MGDFSRGRIRRVVERRIYRTELNANLLYELCDFIQLTRSECDTSSSVDSNVYLIAFYGEDMKLPMWEHLPNRKDSVNVVINKSCPRRPFLDVKLSCRYFSY